VCIVKYLLPHSAGNSAVTCVMRHIFGALAMTCEWPSNCCQNVIDYEQCGTSYLCGTAITV